MAIIIFFAFFFRKIWKFRVLLLSLQLHWGNALPKLQFMIEKTENGKVKTEN